LATGLLSIAAGWPKPALQPLADQPVQHVGQAAGRIGHDDPERLAGPGRLRAQACRRRRRTRARQQRSPPHQ